MEGKLVQCKQNERAGILLVNDTHESLLFLFFEK